jgi:hypothetical protein
MDHSILILDHNQYQEAKILLESIEQCARFDRKVYYLANGNTEDYAYDFYKEGLIDVLIVNKKNNGCGFATMQLFQSCDTEYAMYIQADQYFHRRVDQVTVDGWAEALHRHGPNSSESDVKVSHVDMAGDQGHGEYSERGHFINVDFYNGIPKHGGGPGPYHHLEWTEYSMQQHIKNNNLEIISAHPVIIADAGKWAVRENPDGSRWKHRTDTKELWMISPPSEKYVYPKFTSKEWDKVLSTKTWPDGGVPEEEVESSFFYWK